MTRSSSSSQVATLPQTTLMARRKGSPIRGFKRARITHARAHTYPHRNSNISDALAATSEPRRKLLLSSSRATRPTYTDTRAYPWLILATTHEPVDVLSRAFCRSAMPSLGINFIFIFMFCITLLFFNRIHYFGSVSPDCFLLDSTKIY